MCLFKKISFLISFHDFKATLNIARKVFEEKT